MKKFLLILVVLQLCCTLGFAAITGHPADKVICEGSNTTFSIRTNSPSSTFRWQVNTGSFWVDVPSGGAGPVYTNITDSNLNVNNVVKKNNGYKYRCIVSSTDTSNEATLSVDSLSVAPVSVNATVNPLCNGRSTTLSLTGGSLGTGAGWKWYVSNCTSSVYGTGLTLPVTPTSSTTYYVKAVGLCNTTSCMSINIIVNSPPLIITNPADTIICEGGTVNFTVSASGSALSYLWQVDKGTGFANISSSGSNPVHSNFNTASLKLDNIISWNNGYKYRCIVNGVCAPQDTSGISVLNVNTKPVLSSQPLKSNICDGDNTSFHVSAYGTNLRYQWQFKSVNNWKDINQPGLSPVYSDWGTSVLKLEKAEYINNNLLYRCVVSNAGCPAAISDSVKLTINPLPVINAGPDVSICSGTDSMLSVSVSGPGLPPYNFLWSPSTGLNDPEISNPVAGPASMTRYKVVVTDSMGCVGTDDISVFVNPLPVADAGYDTAICRGDGVKLTGQGGTAYLWTSSIDTQKLVVSNPVVKPAKSAIFRLKVTNINNCTNEDEVRILVHDLPEIDSGEDTTLCFGKTMQLHASGGLFYQWSPSTGLNHTKAADPVSSPLSSMTYYVIGTDLNGCSNMDSVKIRINVLPIVFAGNDTAVCFGDSIQLEGNGGVQYRWEKVPGLNQTTISSPIAKPFENTIFTLHATDLNGCENMDQVKINVNSLPKADAGNDVSVCKGNIVQLQGSGGLYYLWQPGNNLSDSTISSPIATPVQNGKYVLVVTDVNGCRDSDSVEVSVILNPTPQISGDSLVCKNERWAKYRVNSQTADLMWTLSNGIILNGQGSNSISVQWLNNDLNKSVFVTESLKKPPYCNAKDTFSVKSTEGTAPDLVPVTAKSNNISTGILLVKSSAHKIHKWGFENKADNKEIYTCTENNWCSFYTIDTSKYHYWVYIGDDTTCLTKSYFNSPVSYTAIEDKGRNRGISMFPNPTTSGILFISGGDNIKSVHVYNILGETIISMEQNNAEIWNIDLSGYPDGMYVIRVAGHDRVELSKIVKDSSQ